MALEIQATKYNGEFAEQLLIPAIAELTTLQKGVAYFKDGIKFKENVGRITFQKPFQPRVATPTGNEKSKFIVSERELFPQDLMLYDEFNPRDFEAHVLGRQLDERIIGRGLPPTAETAMMSVALQTSMETLDVALWQGSLAFRATAAPDDEQYQRMYFDGFMPKILKTATDGLGESAVFIGSPAVLTSSNIIDAFQKTKNGMTPKLLSKANRYNKLKFLVSVNTEQLLQDAYTNSTFKNNDNSERGIEKFQGFDVVSIYGIPDNTILFGEFTMDLTSNTWIGLNSKEDMSIQIAPLQANSEVWFIKALMKFDTQIAWPKQMVVYTTDVLANYGY